MSERMRDGFEYGFIYLNLLLIFLFYGTVARWSRAAGIDWSPWISTRLDYALPLDLTLFPVYMLAFVSSTFLMLLAYRRAGIEVMRRFFLAGVASMLGCYALYMLFPVTADGLFAAAPPVPGSFAYDVIRRIPLYNSFPSMHVVNAWMAYRIYATYYSEFRRLNLAFFVAVAASTMLLKLHFLADVVAGLVIGELAMRLLVEDPRLASRPPVRAVFFGRRALAAQAAILGLLLALHAEKLRRKRWKATPAALVDIAPVP